MRRSITVCLLGLALVAFGRTDTVAEEASKIPLHVLYLGRPGEAERTRAFGDLLTRHFHKSTLVERDAFRPEMLDGVDVVLLDWSQGETRTRKHPSPLGPRENWDVPLVLLGSAGHILAGPWYVIGGAG